MKYLIEIFAGLFFLQASYGQEKTTAKIDSLLPVRGLAIHAPSSQRVDDFLKFVEDELVPAHFNWLILEVDWNYEYECHPELRTRNPLTKADVKKNE
jgi:transposase